MNVVNRGGLLIGRILKTAKKEKDTRNGTAGILHQ